MKQQQLPKGQQALIKEAIERMLTPTADPLTEHESFDLVALRGMFSEPNDVTISINDDSKAFREKALAFAIDSTRIESMYKDFKELNTSIDSYLDSLVMIPELMCDSFYMCVYDSHHDAIRIEMDNIDKAIYISRDSVSKELVVEYHWGSADIDWGVLYNDDSFFKQMWSEFIWCNPIKEYKTIKDYHVELFFRICYVSDLHSSLYSYNK